MTDFPTIVYRVPGPHYGADGRGFDYRGVDDAEAYDAALGEGWHETIWAAMGGEVIREVAEAAEVVSDVSDDARLAMEAEAKELGVSFNSRTSDKVLAERIAAAQVEAE
jgi:hypothetical protein